LLNANEPIAFELELDDVFGSTTLRLPGSTREDSETDPPRLFPLVPSPLQDASRDIQQMINNREPDLRERIGTSEGTG